MSNELDATLGAALGAAGGGAAPFPHPERLSGKCDPVVLQKWSWLFYLVRQWQATDATLSRMPRTRDEIVRTMETILASDESLCEVAAKLRELAPQVPDFCLIVLSERVDVISADTGAVIVTLSREEPDR